MRLGAWVHMDEFQPASPRGLDCQNMHIYAYSDYYIHIRQSVCPMNSYQRACEA